MKLLAQLLVPFAVFISTMAHNLVSMLVLFNWHGVYAFFFWLGFRYGCTCVLSRIDDVLNNYD